MAQDMHAKGYTTQEEYMDADDEIEDAICAEQEALGAMLGYTRSTVLTHLSRERWDKIPPPSRRLAMGPVWYVGDVEEWKERS